MTEKPRTQSTGRPATTTQSAGRTPTRRRRALAAPVIVVLVVLAFEPVRYNEFVDWDDRQSLIENDAYRGLGVEQLRWMFTTPHAGHYQPLTWLSFALELKLWGGLSAVAVHLTNVALHVLTTLGVYLVALALIRHASPTCSDVGVRLGAAFAALVFGVHPLRVESVAWAVERRDVLSGCLLIYGVVLFIRYATSREAHGRGRWLGAAWMVYVLSLLSKASGVTLPFVLLALDVYPLRRWPRHSGAMIKDAMSSSSGVNVTTDSNRRSRIVMEKLLFAVPAAAAGGAALWAQASAGALWTLEAHPRALRIAQAFYGVIFYVGKTLWPAGLIPLYEQPPNATPFDPRYTLAAACVLAVAAGVFVLRRRMPGLAVSGVAYLLLLAPVSGLSQSGPQEVADRYSYLSCIPWAILAGWVGAATWDCAGRLVSRAVLLGAACAAILVLIVLTRAQTRVWADSYTLWTTVLSRAPDTGLAHANLAVLLNERGDFPAACQHAERAIEILPGNRAAHVARGRCAMELGDLDTAKQHLEEALGLGPVDMDVLTRLAFVHWRMGRTDDAEALYRRALVVDSQSAIGWANLGSFLAAERRLDEASDALRRAVELEPDLVDARERLAATLQAAGEWDEAVGVLREGLSRTPDHPRLLARLAWILATCTDDCIRNTGEALTLASRAREVDRMEDLTVREAYAATLAAIGEFDRAARELETWLAAHQSRLDAGQQARLREQIASYRARTMPPP